MIHAVATTQMKPESRDALIASARECVTTRKEVLS